MSLMQPRAPQPLRTRNLRGTLTPWCLPVSPLPASAALVLAGVNPKHLPAVTPASIYLHLNPHMIVIILVLRIQGSSWL